MKQYSVLIVDDEELALQGLELGIDWDGLNIHRLYKAHCRDDAAFSQAVSGGRSGEDQRICLYRAVARGAEKRGSEQ